jgi:hypothetical protein
MARAVVGTTYLALFVGSLACSSALIPPSVLEKEVGHSVEAGLYLKLAWLGASLATVGGALGSVVESDLAVREAAYRHRADKRA